MAPGTCSGRSAARAARNRAPARRVASMAGVSVGAPLAEQRRDAGALFLELLQRRVHLLARELVDRQARDARVFAARAWSPARRT